MIVCLLMTTNKQSSLTITIKKQTVISHHYHQQINNQLSPLPRDDCLFVDGNGER
jgi:demethoxyubiquinone hydroxylase (CLK1/Coq7/Cat5 family)